MNDLPDLVSQLETAARWDTSAADAYQSIAGDFLRQPKPKTEQVMQTSKETLQLILSGVHAVSLAVSVIEQTEPGSYAHQLSLAVLKDWEVGIKKFAPPTEQASAPDSSAQPTWPPLAPSLDPIYTTHEYIVIAGGGFAYLEPPLDSVPHPDVTRFQQVAISGGEVFRFTGTTLWHQERACCLMRMSHNPGHPDYFWVFSQDLRIGKKIEPSPTEV